MRSPGNLGAAALKKGVRGVDDAQGVPGVEAAVGHGHVLRRHHARPVAHVGREGPPQNRPSRAAAAAAAAAHGPQGGRPAVAAPSEVEAASQTRAPALVALRARKAAKGDEAAVVGATPISGSPGPAAAV